LNINKCLDPKEIQIKTSQFQHQNNRQNYQQNIHQNQQFQQQLNNEQNNHQNFQQNKNNFLLPNNLKFINLKHSSLAKTNSAGTLSNVFIPLEQQQLFSSPSPNFNNNKKEKNNKRISNTNILAENLGNALSQIFGNFSIGHNFKPAEDFKQLEN
jgi:hypothetical protein